MHILSKLRKLHIKPSTFLGLAGILFLLLVTLLSSQLANKNTDLRSRADVDVSPAPIRWKTVQELRDSGQLLPPKEILLAGIHWQGDSTDSEQISITNLKRTQGYLPHQPETPPPGENITIDETKHEFEAQLVDKEGTILVQFPFFVKPGELVDTISTSGKNNDTDIKDSQFTEQNSNEENTAVVLPWKEGVSEIRIVKGQTVFTRQDISALKSEPLSKDPDSDPRCIDTGAPPDPESTLDIIVLSNEYEQEDLHLFHADVEQAYNEFFSIEPFRSRPRTHFRFCKIANSGSFNNTDEFTISRAVESGLPWDVLSVIFNHNGSNASASEDNPITRLPRNLLYNTNLRIFTHEFAHAFAPYGSRYEIFLLDEYHGEPFPIVGPAENPDYVLKNCYQGTRIPPVEWRDMVGINDYFEGCYANFDYRSSQDSIMMGGYSNGADYFNTPSLDLLIRQLHRFTHRHSNDTHRPTVVLTYPEENLVLVNDFPIQARASDNRNIHRVEFFVDDTFYHTQYFNESTVDAYHLFSIAELLDGLHIVKVRAVDSNNNRAEDLAYIMINRSQVTIVPSPTPYPTLLPNINVRVQNQNIFPSVRLTRIELTGGQGGQSQYPNQVVSPPQFPSFYPYCRAGERYTVTLTYSMPDGSPRSQSASNVPCEGNTTFYINTINSVPYTPAPTNSNPTPTRTPTPTPTPRYQVVVRNTGNRNIRVNLIESCIGSTCQSHSWDQGLIPGAELWDYFSCTPGTSLFSRAYYEIQGGTSGATSTLSICSNTATININSSNNPPPVNTPTSIPGQCTGYPSNCYDGGVGVCQIGVTCTGIQPYCLNGDLYPGCHSHIICCYGG